MFAPLHWNFLFYVILCDLLSPNPSKDRCFGKNLNLLTHCLTPTAYLRILQISACSAKKRIPRKFENISYYIQFRHFLKYCSAGSVCVWHWNTTNSDTSELVKLLISHLLLYIVVRRCRYKRKERWLIEGGVTNIGRSECC